MFKCFISLSVILTTVAYVPWTYSTGFEPWVGVVGKIEAQQLLNFREQSEQLPTPYSMSIDMGRSETNLIIDEEGVKLQSTSALLATWDDVKKIAKKESRCYALYDDGSAPWHVTTMSATTRIPASLCQPLNGQGAPTIILGGFTMHRLKGDDMNPMEDTANKIRAVNIRKGARVLDTCMGLGYTAIEAARQAGLEGSVTTCEFDDASVEMCAHNPWSQPLFDKSLPISILRGDSCELIKSFPDNYFDVIIHDPPARALCRKNLYGLEFYKELCRVLTGSGSVVHYIGNPDSKESGRLFPGVIERMREAGFRCVKTEASAFGVVARK